MPDTPEELEAKMRAQDFAILDEHGPKDESLLKGNVFDAKRFWRAEAIGTAVAVVLIAAGLALTAILEAAAKGIGDIGLLMDAVIAGGLVVFALICYGVSTRFILPSKDLLEHYRRVSFQIGCLFGGVFALLAGFTVAFLVSEKPGVLRPEDFTKNNMIILSMTLLVGETISILNVLRAEAKNHKAVAKRIAEWKASRGVR